MTEQRLPLRYSIADLLKVVDGQITERQVRHWLINGWCIDANHVHVGGRIGSRWQFGSSGMAHAQEMARLVVELDIGAERASHIAAALMLSGEYVTEHFSLYATRSLPESGDVQIASSDA